MTKRKTDPVPEDVEGRWGRLQTKILAHVSLLERQGTIRVRLARGKRVYVLRFADRLPDGRSVTRAIYLGAEGEIVRRARVLLSRLRQRARWDDEASLFVKLAATLSHRAKRLSRRLPKQLAS